MSKVYLNEEQTCFSTIQDEVFSIEKEESEALEIIQLNIEEIYQTNIVENVRIEKLNELKQSDYTLIRVIEDIYNVLTEEQKANIPEAAKSKINNRILLRNSIVQS